MARRASIVIAGCCILSISALVPWPGCMPRGLVGTLVATLLLALSVAAAITSLSLTYRNWSRLPDLFRTLGVIPILFLIIQIAWDSERSGPIPGFHDVTSHGAEIINALEEHRMLNHSYPASLAAIASVRVTNCYGGWRYHVNDAGTEFSLVTGDYSLDGFALWWDGDAWYLDQ